MTEREGILGRIREALREAAPQPGAHAEPQGAPIAPPTAFENLARSTGPSYARWLPRVGTSFDERAAAFAAASKELRTDFHLLATEAEAYRTLGMLRDADHWQRISAHEGELTSPAAASLGPRVLWTEGGYEKPELEQCDVGISECDVLVAQTGSVVVTSASAGGRALSVLPPHHVVLARREQLVADLPGAFRLIQAKYAAHYPSMISFITGPSRTGDIERILVLGAHGPKKLTVICW